jgi:tetratricopeptide (TPR) repeat protein
VQDFAAARNFAKAQTQCDYVIALDADERFNGADGPKLREKLNESDARVVFIRLTDAPLPTTLPAEIFNIPETERKMTYLPRILKNVSGNDWAGRVHEAPDCAVGATYMSIDILHLGANHDYRAEKKKHDRNWLLLEEIFKEEPDSQFPLFYSYLACERRLRNDDKGFFEMLEYGWNRHLTFVDKDETAGIYNSGVLATYPIVLLNKGRFKDAMKALGVLIENLHSFSSNAANTLYQVLQSCLLVPLPGHIKQEMFSIILDAAIFLKELDDMTFAEPTIEGATTYSPLQIQAYCLGKLGRFDEAFQALLLASEYENAVYSTALMRIELYLEQGNLKDCLAEYTELLQDNLHTSPDIWVLGALLLIVMNQEDDAKDYVNNATTVSYGKFVSSHRLNLLKGLHTRMCVLNGTPMAGLGAYGVIGAILAREPIETSHQIPSTLIESVVERYVGMGKIEELLPFFDPRAEEILPGCGAIVKAKLESYGVELEDDGQKIPIVLFGTDLEDVISVFTSHPRLNVLDFSDEEKNLVLEEINDVESQVLDDLLFGSMDLFDDEEDDGLSRSKELLFSKYQDIEGEPVLLWPNDWPVSAIENLCPERRAVMYLGSPLKHAKTSQDLYQWHLRNTEGPNALEKNIFYLNAKMMNTNPSHSVNQLMARLGLVSVEVNSVDLQRNINWDQAALSERFTSEFDVDILNVWKFL